MSTLYMNKLVEEIVMGRFEELLAQPELAEVAFSREPGENGVKGWATYNMIPFTVFWAKYVSLLNGRFEVALGKKLPLFSRKYNKEWLDYVRAGANLVTAKEVVEYNKPRFSGIFD